MESKVNADKGKLIGAVIVGALIGVGIGMLFAPNKGSVTRTKLLKSAKKSKDELKKIKKKPSEVATKNSKRPPLL